MQNRIHYFRWTAGLIVVTNSFLTGTKNDKYGTLSNAFFKLWFWFLGSTRSHLLKNLNLADQSHRLEVPICFLILFKLQKGKNGPLLDQTSDVFSVKWLTVLYIIDCCIIRWKKIQTSKGDHIDTKSHDDYSPNDIFSPTTNTFPPPFKWFFKNNVVIHLGHFFLVSMRLCKN